jgi:biotin operon repressor
VSRKKVCCDCGKALKKDEVALTKKLIDLDTEEFYCIDCLAEYIGCAVSDLEIKIQEFKEQGCTLFL